MEAVRAVGLTKVIRGRPVVDGLGLTLEAGEVLGFLGPNGAGKTTTIRMLLGLSRISAGRAEILGNPVPIPPPALARVGAMVEEPAFYRWMSGRRNLQTLLGEGARGPDGCIEAALHRAGIAAAADRKVAAYSQGMRQRLGLAAAIMRRPDVLILDEPANGLDPPGIRDLRLLVRELADRGAAVLLSSHQLGEVEQVCDRVVILSEGRVVAEGATGDLLAEGREIRVEVSSPEEPRARVALASLPMRSDVGALIVEAPSGRYVSELLARSGIFPESLAPIRATLEERFLDLTGEKEEST